MVAAGRALLAALDADQLAIASFDFEDAGERVRWFFTPTDHGGLLLRDCSDRQRQLALRLVATGLSSQGYAQAMAVMSHESILEPLDGWPHREGWGRVRDPLRYAVSVFGRPGESRRWGWRFGGHHLSLSYTVVDGEVVGVTPSFLGLDPATVALPGGGVLRPLAPFEDLARQLVETLDGEQRQRAIVSPAPPIELMTANWPSLSEAPPASTERDLFRDAAEFPGEQIVATLATRHAEQEAALGLTQERRASLRWTRRPVGISGADLDRSQQEVLESLLDAYVTRIPEGRERSDLGATDIHFAWAGDIAPGAPHYYRLQAARLLIEYDNTQRDVNHIHTVWRDPDGDFGQDALTAHYEAEHAQGIGASAAEGKLSQPLPGLRMEEGGLG